MARTPRLSNGAIRYVNYNTAVADAAALRAIGTSERLNGDVVFVYGLEKSFWFNGSGSGTDDGIKIITPNTGSGRWYSVKHGLDGVVLTYTGNDGTIRFYDNDGSHYFGLKAHGTTTASTTYTWPAAAPGTSGHVLTSATNGAMSWSSILALGVGSTSGATYGVSGEASGIYFPAASTVGVLTNGTLAGQASSGIWMIGYSAGLGSTGSAYHQINGAIVNDLGSTFGVRRGSIANADAITLSAGEWRDGAGAFKSISGGIGYSRLSVARTTAGSGAVFSVTTNFTDSQTTNVALTTTNQVTILNLLGSGSMTLTGSLTAGSTVIPSGSGVTGGLGSVLMFGGSAVSVTNNSVATYAFGSDSAGLLLIYGTGGAFCMFAIGPAGAINRFIDLNANFDTAATAGRTQVQYSSGSIVLTNRTGATATYNVMLVKAN